jgi:hypothetical protein
MGAEIPMPSDFVESLSRLRFPPESDSRLQELMTRNTEGALSPQEHHELQSLVELSEMLSLIRAKALMSLGRSP